MGRDTLKKVGLMLLGAGIALVITALMERPQVHIIHFIPHAPQQIQEQGNFPSDPSV